MEPKKQISGLLSIARKGNFAVIGFDNIKKQRKSLNLILLCTTASPKLKKEAIFFQGKLKSDLIELDNLADYIQIESCKIVGINNEGISNSLKKIFRGEI